MTRVSFYILKGSEEADRQEFACRLAEKAYKLGKQVYIHAPDEQQCEQINQTLWSFRADSFVPHELDTGSNESDCPVLIGHTSAPPRLMDLLINLDSEQPKFFSQFERVAELINDDEQIKTSGRDRYQFYKHRGYELETHHL
ncbi:MAG: DNA polymerase III subunit chi [Gammaproteobacteria bacterium]|nr:DNA polymerase III subunit chi [Gammaproteobacteria bacterium]